MRYTIRALDDDGHTVSFRINTNVHDMGDNDIDENYGTGTQNYLDWIKIDSSTGVLSATICDEHGRHSKRFSESDNRGWLLRENQEVRDNANYQRADRSISRYTLQVHVLLFVASNVHVDTSW